ncbi:putative type VI secretion system effector [Acinetobacter sp. V91_7]|uniref:putative type VI secretion system effector n=1 Tax=unclassified Acinetobacter TaxID=196816 RepID=UPI00287C7E98|nr:MULTISPECIES: putative type VI secretion system effector [unclassified Acinetobacter]MDS7933918.1 putative type VI secretion system effector [Acinetobacter sp. V91_4B]MDS7962746.1 putative type VI secretion system effector [Acinetobacter sp. V91_7]MDS8029351.1 putative type VI secretion system effector [Acinetobacter sp. V91_13]
MKLHLKLVKGPIHSLEKAKSKIPVNQNIGGIAAGTTFAGVLAESSSLLTSAPILVMAAKAKDGITFIGEIDGYPVIGQFTAARFEENDELIAVISEKPVDGRYQVYAIVDPKSGLLYMIYEMGRSVKMGYKAIAMQTYYFTLICWGGISIMLLLFYLFDFDYSWKSFFDLIKWLFMGLFLCIAQMAFINYFAYRKSYENFGTLSEQIFEKLGFENPKEQDFYNDFLTDDGVQISVMKYRKNLKGKDPYPEDYFDKKNF